MVQDMIYLILCPIKIYSDIDVYLSHDFHFQYVQSL